MNETFDAYCDKVFDYMEYLGIPELIVDFDMTDVAKSFNTVLIAGYIRNITVRMCAIIIYSLTMNYHVIPASKREVKH